MTWADWQNYTLVSDLLYSPSLTLGITRECESSIKKTTPPPLFCQNPLPTVITLNSAAGTHVS